MKINIQVICEQQTLKIHPENAAFEPGDVVVWEFVNLPSGCVPDITFMGRPLGTGSFTSLRWIDSCVIASGTTVEPQIDQPVVEHYTAAVRTLEGTLLQANGRLEIKTRIMSPAWESNLDVLVQVDPDRHDQLTFAPDADLQIVAGDTVTWYFYLDFEPEDVHISFINSSTGTEDPFGPFQSIRVKRFNPGGRDWTEVGTTKAELRLRCTLQASGADAVKGQYAYTLYADKPDLRLWLRRKKFSGDPMVDNLGPPIDG